MGLHDWSYIAQVILTIEALVPILVCGVIAYFLVRGTNAVLRALPAYFRRAHQIMENVRAVVERITAAAVSPLIRIEAGAARIRGTLAGIRKWLLPRFSRMRG